MAEELQKDPLTRGNFLLLGALGTFVGAVLTLPPVVYFLSPSIKSVLQGKSDVPDDWKELASVFTVPGEEPLTQLIEFPQYQTYDSGQPDSKVGTITNAVLISWKDGKMPEMLKKNGEARRLTSAEIEELSSKMNVMANACTHMGCPVRWSVEKKEIDCPCHGGIYTINGTHIGGPPPHGLWKYIFEIREDGKIYIKHSWQRDGKPYVI